VRWAACRREGCGGVHRGHSIRGYSRCSPLGRRSLGEVGWLCVCSTSKRFVDGSRLSSWRRRINEKRVQVRGKRCTASLLVLEILQSWTAAKNERCVCIDVSDPVLAFRHCQSQSVVKTGNLHTALDDKTMPKHDRMPINPDPVTHPEKTAYHHPIV
jgi:hypothetical protein